MPTPPAVVLLSRRPRLRHDRRDRAGATGFDVARAHLSLRPAPRRRARARRDGWPTRSGSPSTSWPNIDLRRLRRIGAHGGHRRAEGPPPSPEIGQRIPLPTSRRATRSSCRFALAWAEVLGAPRHLHRRERARLQRLPRLPARVHRRLRAHGQPRDARRRRGRARLTIHTPLIDLTKAEIIALGTRLGVDYALTVELLRPDAGRRGVRPLRRVPAPPARASRRRASPIRRRTRRTRTGMTLHREGDLLHAAGRGRQRRTRRRVLPLLPAATCGPAARRTAPKRSASSATPISSAPTAPAAASSPTPPTLADAREPRVAGRRGQRRTPSRGLHRRRAAAPARRALLDGAARRGFEVAVETNGTRARPPGSTGSA